MLTLSCIRRAIDTRSAAGRALLRQVHDVLQILDTRRPGIDSRHDERGAPPTKSSSVASSARLLPLASRPGSHCSRWRAAPAFPQRNPGRGWQRGHTRRAPCDGFVSSRFRAFKMTMSKWENNRIATKRCLVQSARLGVPVRYNRLKTTSAFGQRRTVAKHEHDRNFPETGHGHHQTAFLSRTEYGRHTRLRLGVPGYAPT